MALSSFSRKRNSEHKPFLSRLAWITVLSTLLLLLMGGFTTSIGAGMAFLDWPLSDGSVNPEGWLSDQDMFAEHSHRLLGSLVGLLVMALALALYLREDRVWLRQLAVAAFILVSIQGLLGGGRVLFDQLNIGGDHNLLAQTLAIIHACAAQLFLCVIVALTIGLSRVWIERTDGFFRSAPSSLRAWGFAACAVIFIQLILGAVMRHHHAGLAIPYFPLSSPDSLLPATWNFRVNIHFAHRVGALVVTAVLLGFAWKLFRNKRTSPLMNGLNLLMILLLGLQIYLGAAIILFRRAPYPTTLHVITGAVLLAVCWSITFLACRKPREPSETPEPRAGKTATLAT